MKPTNTQQGTGTTAGKTQQWEQQNQGRPGQTKTEGGLDRQQQGGKTTINPKEKDTTKGGRGETGTGTGTGSGSGKPF